MNVLTGNLGSTILTFGSIAKENVWATIKMLQSQKNVSTLSEPFLLTTNMKEATVSVGSKRRVTYNQAVSETGDTGSAQGFTDAKAALTVKVTPQLTLKALSI